MRNYQEIKEELRKVVADQDNVTDQELEDLDDELIELIDNAEHGKGELVSFVEDIQIYDSVKKGISINSEPRILRAIIRDLRYELDRPKNIREKVEWRTTYLKGDKKWTDSHKTSTKITANFS